MRLDPVVEPRPAFSGVPSSTELDRVLPEAGGQFVHRLLECKQRNRRAGRLEGLRRRPIADDVVVVEGHRWSGIADPHQSDNGLSGRIAAVHVAIRLDRLKGAIAVDEYGQFDVRPRSVPAVGEFLSGIEEDPDRRIRRPRELGDGHCRIGKALLSAEGSANVLSDHLHLRLVDSQVLGQLAGRHVDRLCRQIQRERAVDPVSNG